MRRFCLISLAATLTAAPFPASSGQISGRFGFEYNEARPWNHPKHELLLDKMARAGEHGDINVNVLAGTWGSGVFKTIDP